MNAVLVSIAIIHFAGLIAIIWRDPAGIRDYHRSQS